MAQVNVHGILEKLQSKDKDFRYMATSDLQNELLKDRFQFQDEFTERKLCTAILQQLEDVSGDISALAVKCLGLLVRKVSVGSVETMVTSLGTKLTTGKKDDEREIAGIGLKTAVQELPRGPTAKAAVKKLTPPLISGLGAKEANIVSASLEVLNDLLTKFGGLMTEDHVRLTESLLPLLEANRPGVKKRATHCLGALAPYLNDGLLAEAVAPILEKLRSSNLASDDRLSNLQALGALSRAAGWRLKKEVNAAIPLVLAYCRSASEEESEVREACLQALEAIVLRSPREAEPKVMDILELTLQSLAYDPNYADDMEEDEEEEDAEEDDGLSDEGYSDDEDVSWKVRRAAAKTLSAIISEYPHLLDSIYPAASQALLARFREREEAVKLDAFTTLVDLIHQVGLVSKRGAGSSSAVRRLQADVPGVLKAAARQLRDKSPKTRAAIFRVLKELVIVQPDTTAGNIEQLTPGISAALEDKSSAASALRIQALEFLALALAGASSRAWQAQITRLAPPVFAAVGDRYYKAAAAAIRVCEALVTAIRPQPSAPLEPALQGLVLPLFHALQPKLAAQEQDQEVKEAAISCAATAIASLGDVSNGEYAAQLKVLAERLENDSTRLAAVKAVAKVAASPLRLPLGQLPSGVLQLLLSFLRKADRNLRQAALSAIDALLVREETSQGAGQVVDALQPLIKDSDLLLTASSLNVASTLLRHHQPAAAAACSKLLPPALKLAQSPLLQASALEALKAFLIALLHARTPAASFEGLLSSLLAAGNAEEAGKAAQANVAACVAALAAAAGPEKVTTTVKSLLAVLAGTGGPPAARHLALLSIGEIGRTTDLSSFRELQQALTAALGSSSEDLKTAAAHALGAVAVGNLDSYLPFVLQQVQEQAANPKDQYLLLRALSEVLNSLAALPAGAAQLPPNCQSEVLTLLLGNCRSEDECRTVVAECLGRLALLAPDQVVGALQQAVGQQCSQTRATVVAALKHALVEQPHPIDAVLQPALPGFLGSLKDSDRHVRKAAVQLLGAAAHIKPSLVRDLLPDLLPLLYDQTKEDPSLVRTVDLGPFKHKIDDGLELRKAAFECMDVLLDTAADQLYLPDFAHHLKNGLGDHYDVKMPCHLLLAKLAARAGGKLIGSLDDLALPLEKTLLVKLKTDAVKQEVDRNEDMLRSCLRAVDACSRIPNAETSTKFQNLLQNTVLQPPLAVKFETIRKERADVEGRSSGL